MYWAVVTTACNQGGDNPEAVRVLLDDYESALRSKSSEKIARIFHEDATILPEGKNIVSGRANIVQHFKGLETIDFEENFIVEESFLAGAYIVVQTKNRGRWSMPGKDEFNAFEGKGQLILKQNDAKAWKIFKYAYSGNTPAAEKYPQAIEGDFAHTVFFWLKDDRDENARNRFTTSLTRFITNSEYVKSMHIGTPAGTNRTVVDNSYSYCLIVTFSSKEEHDKYQKEQVHLDFIEASKALWNRVLVYDSVRK